MKTISANKETARHEWFVVDASEHNLGRLASEVASRLKGKHKAEYTPHVDTGDYIVVINADKVKVTGNKMQDKMYYHHTGYIGNLKSANLSQMLERRPQKVIELAVKGMMPKNPLGRAMIKKLKVYVGDEHPHDAQTPQPLSF